MWFALSLLSAFGQSLSWALKKKTLENKGVNNTLGLVASCTSGFLLLALFVIVNGWGLPELSQRFWFAALVVIFTNILAAWMAYRALDRAPLSLLMPLMPLSTFGVIPIEYFVRGTVLNAPQLGGAVLLVFGAIIFGYKQFPDKRTLKAVGYFTVTLICFAFANPYMAVAIEESQSALLSAGIFALGMSAGFAVLVVCSKELRVLKSLAASGGWRRPLLLMVLSGVVLALLENGPATWAMKSASASEVIALKRTMPFFALVVGIIMFNEKVTKKHVFGTFLLVTGSILIVWFR